MMTCKTWQDVLIEKGFDPVLSKSFIGFISWNKGEKFTKLGKELTELLLDHRGSVFIKDVSSSKYNDTGLVLFNTDISEDVADEVFEAIMDYEQNNVYDTLL
ncbi:hypothetical protein [Clostridium magnum]|nr:hypothetical protein [Clostridium magnum]